MSEFLATRDQHLQDLVNNSPLVPGCYLYRNKDKKILYIGKAKVIRKRVKSYFLNYLRLDPKIQVMIEQVDSIDFVIADSEVEALILESKLIKKYKPRYNSMLVDDKNYIWVRIDRRKGAPIPKGEKSKIVTGVDYPTLQILRTNLEDGAHYFGPYPDTAPVYRTIERIRKLYPFCTDSKKIERSQGRLISIHSNHLKPCFHYHLGQCRGACAGLETKEDYNKRIEDIKKFFTGEKEHLIAKLEKEMQFAAKIHNFELAATLRDRIHDLRYVAKYLHFDEDMDEVDIMQKKDAEKKSALEHLISYLHFPQLSLHPQLRIECYDISNIQGTNAVGAMTVMIDGKVDPKLYRKFRIRMKNEPNDFAMMQETLFRRFYSYLVKVNQINHTQLVDSEGFLIDPKKYLQVSDKQFDESLTQIPDLIVIDGGKGQLSSAFKIMQAFGLDIPMIGLAKKQEEVFAVKQQRISPELIQDSGVSLSEIEFEKIHLPKTTQASFLLQRIRDEAHRFGITYHRKLRVKQKFSTAK